MRRVTGARSHARRGFALVTALGLLLLSAALLAGTMAASAGIRRGTRGLVAVARAESEGRRALGDVMAGWAGAADSLPIGGALERLPTAPAGVGPPVVVRLRLQRLTSGIFVASVLVQVGTDGSVLARRHVGLLLERMPLGDSVTAAGPLLPIARWSAIDLH